MKIPEMIEVLQAAERGEEVFRTERYKNYDWELNTEPFDFVHYEYRIAPKKETTLVEALRAWPVGELARRAADRIEELERGVAVFGARNLTTDELLAEIKRRTEK